jgi:hypothetical protein
MSLNIRAVAGTAGLTAGALFLLCAAAVAIAPGPTTAFAGFLIHTDLSDFTRSLSWSSFLGGLAAWAIGTGLVAAFAARLYNRLNLPQPRG